MMTTEDAYKDHAWIETATGKVWTPTSPKFDILDIAHALSLNCRYNGHCREFYSVAEHSVLVSQLMEDLKLGDPVEGILHDGTEAYMSDMPSPLKQFLPDYQRLDKRLEWELRLQFSLPEEKTEGCKKADWLALFIEAAYLIQSQGRAWADPHNLRGEALKLATDYPIRCYGPVSARTAFLQRYKEIA